jgi:hypothetical protein
MINANEAYDSSTGFLPLEEREALTHIDTLINEGCVFGRTEAHFAVKQNDMLENPKMYSNIIEVLEKEGYTVIREIKQGRGKLVSHFTIEWSESKEDENKK